MKHYYILIFLVLTLLSFQEKEVYICTGKSNKAYHLKKDCSGIKQCKATIKKVTKQKAENVGRTYCKIEQKKDSILK